MKLLLSLLLLASAAAAQEVKPVLSNDYLLRIRKDKDTTVLKTRYDSVIVVDGLRLGTPYDRQNVGRIITRNHTVILKQGVNKSLRIAGNYDASFELNAVNHLPKLQDQYVQGGTQNGTVAWQGPETGTPYSFGPDINTLEYDGSSYAYDVNGRLVPRGSGNGKAARPYANDFFRTGSDVKQSLNLQARYMRSYQQAVLAKLRLGHSMETLFIPGHKNNSRDLMASVEASVGKFGFTGSYRTAKTEYTRSNRTGILNRLYEDALLTPISFDNTQSERIATGQRSFSPSFDNPDFLLHSAPSGFTQSETGGSFSAVYNLEQLRFTLTPSVDVVRQEGGEGYGAGTAFFPGGYSVNRNQVDRKALMKFSGRLKFPYYGSAFTNYVFLNYTWSGEHTNISYDRFMDYHYNRDAHVASLVYQGIYRFRNSNELGLELSNKMQASNTLLNNRSFLPAGELSYSFYNRPSSIQVKISTAMNHSIGEVPVGSSFAQQQLTAYSSGQSLAYLPVKETTGFTGLSAIRHRDESVSLQLTYKNRLTLTGNLFHRYVRDDIFPVLQGSDIVLKNMADHRTRGAEIDLGYSGNSRKLALNSHLGFFSKRTIVMKVQDGYEGKPIAGFSNAYLSLVSGRQLGVIVGSAYLRDAGGQVVIGNDGFPLVDPSLRVVGNPNPDFVLKTSHSLTWKHFILQADVEWSKGGEFWNGTQAALDYYGRSQVSADQRNISNFVFAGVREDGHINDQAVRFYDPSLPVTLNRWTRYGEGGVTEEYIQKADYLRLNSLGLAYQLHIRKYIQSIKFNLYIQNILLWSASDGVQPGRSLYDTPGSEGLSYFNLPSVRTFGFLTSIQF